MKRRRMCRDCKWDFGNTDLTGMDCIVEVVRGKSIGVAGCIYYTRKWWKFWRSK